MQDISIKNIQVDMIPLVAQLHMAAFQNYPNTCIGLPYVTAFIRWFCEAQDAIALCAINGTDKTVGYVVGAPLGYTTSLNRAVIWPAILGLLQRPWLLFRPDIRPVLLGRFRSFVRPKSISSPNEPTLPAPTISLVGIGVDPQARGQRVGQKLLDAFEQQVTIQKRGKSMRLSVYRSNDAARKLYEKAGWQIFLPKNYQTRLIYYYKMI